MNSQITKPFEWTIQDGKQYATQRQFAELLGIKVQNVKRHLSQRGINLINLIRLSGTKQILYPADIVKMAILTLETKSDLGIQLKKFLVEQAIRQPTLPKAEALQLAPPKATRDQLREVVAEIATRNDIPYNEVWHKLWNELYYRCKVNVRLRAKNQDKRPLDVIDELDLCPVSISILKEVYA